MKNISVGLAAALAGVLMSQPVAAEVSGNIGFTSNYLWRGVSQTADDAAIQGGVDYGHESGFYAGTWVSNVDFGDGTSYEMDLYAGFEGEFGDGFGYDVGYLYYGYPDSPGSISFGELYGSLSWKWITLGYAKFIHAGSDVAADGLDDEDYSYLTADVSVPVTEMLTLDFHYGYNDGDVISSWFGTDSYSDYHVALSAATKMGDVSFAVADTDLDDDDVKVVLGYTYNFDF
ncbi:TorF family putative porin [Shewanella corallii]|uniref:TorF family putative porin n=2 Tax=Shewanella TaxID=22 RepID=A0ABT0N7Y0_9GAMM|nr:MULTISPECIES: TorF family putative porin [Shewanella]MCL1038449.1 TorF family putative porin [Shewanella submarina]MCL2914562.1 TorF family putative porin [Shewanella corallii]